MLTSQFGCQVNLVTSITRDNRERNLRKIHKPKERIYVSIALLAECKRLNHLEK